MRLRRLILILFAAFALTVSAAATQRAWEEIDHYPEATAMTTAVDNEDIKITTRDGYVYVSVRQTSNVKIFTILGQLIVQQQLKPGNYRFRLGSRGIYIFKAGSMTRRVTI